MSKTAAASRTSVHLEIMRAILSSKKLPGAPFDSAANASLKGSNPAKSVRGPEGTICQPQAWYSAGSKRHNRIVGFSLSIYFTC